MAKLKFILALDQGTTSSRAVLYDSVGNEVAIASRPLAIRCPFDGWVEQDADELWRSQFECALELVSKVSSENIQAIGISNQRETTVAWSRKTGRPLAPAIVWQCRRSAEICARFRGTRNEKVIRDKTGLVVDSYFSASKILWLLENIPGLRALVASGEVVFGTVDSWLVYNLTGGAQGGRFVTEHSNASRTLLYNIHTGSWDKELLSIFQVPEQSLPEILPSNSLFGTTTLFGSAIPIHGILGDQQASLFGNGCFEPQSAKCTFGTGAFLLLNTGEKPVSSSSGLLSTVAWVTENTSSKQQSRTYALEGSIFMAGALVQWLRDKLGIIKSSVETESICLETPDSLGVVVVPAFVGLGAPHWDESARGAIFGLTREANFKHIVRAALEGIAHQVADILETPEFQDLETLSIDGGMSVNSAFAQILADTTNRKIQPATSAELTAFGAARMAFAGVSGITCPTQLRDSFEVSSHAARNELYVPRASQKQQYFLRGRWKEAVAKSRGWV